MKRFVMATAVSAALLLVPACGTQPEKTTPGVAPSVDSPHGDGISAEEAQEENRVREPQPDGVLTSTP